MRISSSLQKKCLNYIKRSGKNVFKPNKVSSIIYALLFAALVSTATGSSVPDEDALRGIEATTTSSAPDQDFVKVEKVA